MHRAHGRAVLLAHLGEGSAALLDVALEAPHQADVGVGVDEDLQVHVGAEALIRQHQDPFDDHHRCRLDPTGLGAPHVLSKVVLGDVDRPTGAQVSELVDQQLGLDRVRMIVVDEQPLGGRHRRAIAVVGVVIDDHQRAPGQARHQPLGDGGLAGPGASRDSQHEHARRLPPPLPR